MGLLEQIIGKVLGGSQSGGYGRSPGGFGGSPGGLGGGGISPIVMALMALLASRGSGAGGLGGMLGGGGGLGGMLGGLLGGGQGGGGRDNDRGGRDLAGAFDGPAGSGGGFGGGFGGLLERFTQSGHRNKIESWIGPGQNEPIAPEELDQALGPDTIDTLSRQTGMPKGDLLSQLSQILPSVVDQLTPHGRMPQREEMERW